LQDQGLSWKQKTAKMNGGVRWGTFKRCRGGGMRVKRAVKVGGGGGGKGMEKGCEWEKEESHHGRDLGGGRSDGGGE